MIQLDVLQGGNTCTLRVKGRLVLGEALDHFDAAVQQALESEHHFLILNLEAMPVIDSSGIGAVVNALQAKKLGGGAKLVNPSPFATGTFKLMCIHDLLPCSEPRRMRSLRAAHDHVCRSPGLS